jgi:hypothetical protein
LFIFEHAAPQPVKPCPLLAIFMPRANDPEKIARVVAFSLDEYCSKERFEDNPVTANGANRAANHDLIEDAGDLGRLAIERAAAEARYARFVNSGQRQRPDGYADKWRANPELVQRAYLPASGRWVAVRKAARLYACTAPASPDRKRYHDRMGRTPRVFARCLPERKSVLRSFARPNGSASPCSTPSPSWPHTARESQGDLR